VVSVELQGVLDVVVQAYSKSGVISAGTRARFTPRACNVSQQKCRLDDAEVTITVAWSRVATNKKLVALEACGRKCVWSLRLRYFNFILVVQSGCISESVSYLVSPSVSMTITCAIYVFADWQLAIIQKNKTVGLKTVDGFLLVWTFWIRWESCIFKWWLIFWIQLSIYVCPLLQSMCVRCYSLLKFSHPEKQNRGSVDLKTVDAFLLSEHSFTQRIAYLNDGSFFESTKEISSIFLD
jgi:hypothetical protein